MNYILLTLKIMNKLGIHKHNKQEDAYVVPRGCLGCKVSTLRRYYENIRGKLYRQESPDR